MTNKYGTLFKRLEVSENRLSAKVVLIRASEYSHKEEILFKTDDYPNDRDMVIAVLGAPIAIDHRTD